MLNLGIIRFLGKKIVYCEKYYNKKLLKLLLKNKK